MALTTLCRFKVFNRFSLNSTGPITGQLVKYGRFSSGKSVNWKSYNRRKRKTYLPEAGIAAVLTIGGYHLYKFLSALEIPPKQEQIITVEDPKTSDNSFSFIAKDMKSTLDAVVTISSMSWQGLLGKQVIPNAFGFAVSRHGEIITNSHIAFQSRGNVLKVELKDGRIYEGVVKYVDYDADLALVKIETENIIFMDLGSTKDLNSGAWVAAIDDPNSEKESVAVGVIKSVPGGDKDDLPYIQINPLDKGIFSGLAGGALLSLTQEIVGFNLMTFRTGVSLATPVENVKDFLAESRRSFSLKYKVCLGKRKNQMMQRLEGQNVTSQLVDLTNVVN